MPGAKIFIHEEKVTKNERNRDVMHIKQIKEMFT